MGEINKGTIASIDGNTARVVPSVTEERPTAKIVIPWHLRGDTGKLQKGTEVIYVEFPDATGLLLGRADGNWGEYLPLLIADNIRVEETQAGVITASGDITAANVSAPSGDVTASGVSLRGLSGVSEVEYYEGEYTVTPEVEGQTLETAGKMMGDNVTINDIPLYDTSNTSGGTTVYIASGVKEG